MAEDGDAATRTDLPTAIEGEEPSPPAVSDASLDPAGPWENRREIFRALEVVERDSAAIADSFTSLFSSLRLALSEATSTSVENMQCFSDVVGRLQESALDASTKGNKYINSCLRLNEEMKGLDSLAMQLFAGPGCEQIASSSITLASMVHNFKFTSSVIAPPEMIKQALEML
ncbi:uncharacterized protein [Typha latifolia]|uniref:uncharacterized protein n=1 Tax=Typha latifolia TaxID=4733 RepID=UPI003C2F3AC3